MRVFKHTCTSHIHSVFLIHRHGPAGIFHTVSSLLPLASIGSPTPGPTLHFALRPADPLISTSPKRVRQGEKAIKLSGSPLVPGRPCGHLEVEGIIVESSAHFLPYFFQTPLSTTYQIWCSTTPDLYCLLRNKERLWRVSLLRNCWTEFLYR